MDGVFVDFCTPFSGPGLGQVLREELDTLKAKRQELRKEISATWRVWERGIRYFLATVSLLLAGPWEGLACAFMRSIGRT